MAWPNVQTVVSQAALELGLSSVLDLGDPYSSQDPNVVLLLGLLKRAGRELVDVADWTHLRHEFSFKTSMNFGGYQLPPDFRDMIDQTGWNRTSRLPMSSLSAQQWQYLKARQTGVVFNVMFRPTQGLMFMYPETPTYMNVSYEYKSAWWVSSPDPAKDPPKRVALGTYKFGDIVCDTAFPQPPIKLDFWRCVRSGHTSSVHDIFNVDKHTRSGIIEDGSCHWCWWGSTLDTTDRSGIATQDIPTSAIDTLQFDESLLTAKLKLLWLKAKGFDWVSVEDEYKTALEATKGNDTVAPTLTLGGSGIGFDPLLSGHNIPITGFGG
jgi:hypothetical protein